MKELSIEDKANRYDKAIEIAKSKIKNDKDHVLYEDDVMEIFPELKESEDEDEIIRKGIIKSIMDLNADWIGLHGVTKEDAIAWLEKQGDNKDIHLLELKAKAYDDAKERMSYAYNQNRVPIGFISEIFPNLNSYENQFDKVEPKFKVGQWIVLKDKCYKVNYNGCGYELIDQSGLSTSLEYGTIDENTHLWTIEDAKDGDVLCSPFHNLIWIYKNSGQYHACVNTNYVQHYDFDANGLLGIPKDVFPATKDEQTILFERIKEAGYEWNADKKELIKL